MRLFFGLGALLSMGSVVFAVDLPKEGESVGNVKDVGLTYNIADEMKKPTVGYVSLTYKKNFEVDPFGNATLRAKDMSKKLRIAGVENVKDALSLEGCSLPDNVVWSLLYNFVPQFRSEVAKNIKEGQRNYDSKDYVFERESVEEYCKMYFTECAKKDSETETGGVSSKTPDNVMTNCQEFFKENYEHGHDKQRLVQNLYVANLGADKYWNTNENDSPYDIMVDLGTYAEVMFEDAEKPVEITFYTQEENAKTSSELKPFQSDKVSGPLNTSLQEGIAKVGGSTSSSSNTKGGDTSLSKQGNVGGSTSSTVSSSNGGKPGTRGVNVEGQTSVNGRVLSNNNGGDNSTSNGVMAQARSASLAKSKEFVEAKNTYEKLVKQLGQQDGDVAGLGDACEGGSGGGGGGGGEGDDTEYVEEPSLENEDESSDDEEALEFTVEEYQELVDYMLDSMDKYTALSEEKEKEIEGIAGDTSRYVDDVTADQLENSAKQIKNCWKSCEGLRIDQKATCMIKCACGEIESPIFDPEKNPGLGPIFVIRYCSVPGKYKKFSIGGRRSISIEEGLDQIYGMLDKLSREARLGVWTQQYEFLDSSTKKMNVASSVAFTIDVQFVDITNSDSKKKSEQYQKRELKKQDDVSKVEHNVSQPLNNPVTKNNNIAVGSTTARVGDVVAGANSDVNRNAVSSLEVVPARVISYLMNGDAQRYSMLASDFDALLDQRSEFWKEVYELLAELNSITIMLLNKPECGCSS